MKTVLTRRLNYLHSRLHADFGDTDAQTVWLGSDGGPWTKVSVMQSRVRPSQKELMGLTAIGTGTVVLFAKLKNWPGVKLNDNFLLGPASSDDPRVPGTDLQRYQVTAAPTVPALDWIRIEAEVH